MSRQRRVRHQLTLASFYLEMVQDCLNIDDFSAECTVSVRRARAARGAARLGGGEPWNLRLILVPLTVFRKDFASFFWLCGRGLDLSAGFICVWCFLHVDEVVGLNDALLSAPVSSLEQPRKWRVRLCKTPWNARRVKSFDRFSSSSGVFFNGPPKEKGF